MSDSHGVLAIISKKIFEKDFPDAKPGAVLGIDRYNSANKRLAPLGDGLPLILVTVRLSDRLLLVAVLEGLSARGGTWVATAKNAAPVADVTRLIPKLRFTTGKGINAKPGALGMSLQTPRPLTEADMALLRAACDVAVPSKQRQTKPRKAKAQAKPAKQSGTPVSGQTVEQQATAALEALKAQQPERALTALLELWRVLPAAVVAEGVEAVSSQITAQKDLSLVSGKSKKAQQLWLETARKRDPGELDRLLSCLTDVTAADVATRLDVLADWPDDPRFDKVVAQKFEAIPFRATSTQKFWRRLLKRAHRLRDPRVLPTLERLDALYAADYDTTSGQWLREQVNKLLTELRPTLEDNTKLNVPPKAAKLLAKLGQVHRPSARVAQAADRADAQLRRVLDSPDDDEARLIYADLLTQLGDPRGELIVLQYQKLDGTQTKDGKKREKELLKTHRKHLLGPLAPLILKRGMDFERGFLSRCEIKDKSQATINALTGHPLWSTVVHMEGPFRLFAHPVMKSLRSVVMQYDVKVGEVCAADRELPIETLVCSIYPEENTQDPAALARSPALPNLRELEMEADADFQYETVLNGAVMERLRRLYVRFPWRTAVPADSTHGRSLHDWLALVEGRHTGIETLKMEFDQGSHSSTCFTFNEPDAESRYSKLYIFFDAPSNSYWVEQVAAEVAAVLDGIDPKRLRSLIIKARSYGKLHRSISVVRAAAKRFEKIPHLEVP